MLAATIEAVIAKDLAAAAVTDPDLPGQTITPRRALAELNRIRQVTMNAGGRTITVITKRNALQTSILQALTSWGRLPSHKPANQWAAAVDGVVFNTQSHLVISG